MKQSRPTYRQERISELIRDCLSNLLIRGSIKDPRLQGASITAVDISPDLKIAKIYYSVLADRSEIDKTNAKEGFNNAAGFIRKEIAANCGLRFAPELKFFQDESLKNAQRIEELIQKIHEKP